MKLLVTGSAGHLGEALVRDAQSKGLDVVGIDIKTSPFTHHVGSISNPDFVQQHMRGVDVVYHSATLHKPHVVTHSKQQFVNTNIIGTQVLLDAAISEKARAFIYTSTTSVFGDAMRPRPGDPAVWVTEDLVPQPSNIYSVTKLTAERLCELAHKEQGLACVVLRTSRFFPEDDDDRHQRQAYATDNLKVNELLFRRADLADIVAAHFCAQERALDLGFARFIITATTPFQRRDATLLGTNVAAVLERYAAGYQVLYQQRGWRLMPTIGRVYDNAQARAQLDWQPTFSFQHALAQLQANADYRSELAQLVGSKGYHSETFSQLTEGPYPVTEPEPC